MMLALNKRTVGLFFVLVFALTASLFIGGQRHALAATTYKWSGNNIVGSDKSTFQPVAGTNNQVLINNEKNGTCESSGILKVDNSGKSGTLYPLYPAGDARARASLNNVDTYNLSSFLSNPGQCKGPGSSDVKTISISGTAPSSFNPSGIVNCDPSKDSSCICSSQGCTQTTPNVQQSSDQTDACGANTNGLALAWLICPSIDAASGMANGLENLYENQLSFTVSQLLGSSNSQVRTKTTWSLMKNLASAFLVIIMLVAVLSQAFGGGLLDAYAIRKILPRLVVAVILIQVSWYLLAWVVDFFNALGTGIANLMYVPFGGSEKMQLGTLLQNANISPVYTGTVGWLGMAAIIGFGIADLPMLLLLVLGVVVALVIALVTLMFRKILIIMCLIFAPLALLAWILPGTQRYYKMWSDNFLKALFMFPLVVAIIAAGRIFAYIAGTQDNSQFLNLFMVLVGFFGPLFILPKTFKWGGQVMSMTGNGISQGFNKLSSPGKSYLQGLHGRSRWMMAKQTRESIQNQRARMGFAEGLTRNDWRGSINRARLVRPGRPGEESEILRRATQHAQIEKAKAWEEERSAAEAELTMVLLPQMVNRGASHDLVREAIALRKKGAVVGREVVGTEKYIDPRDGLEKERNVYRDIVFDGEDYANKHHLSQRAALDRMVVHGQWGAIDEYLEKSKRGTPDERAAADGFKNDSKNAPAIGAKLTHQLKGWSVAVASNEGDIGNMSGHEVESILAHYTTQIENARHSTDPAEIEQGRQAAEALRGFRTRFDSAVRSPSVHVDTRAVLAMQAYEKSLTGDTAGIDDINTGSNKVREAEARGDIGGLTPQYNKETVEGVKREGSRTDYGLEPIQPVENV